MKIKYKKVAIFVTMGTLAVALVSFSINGSKNKEDDLAKKQESSIITEDISEEATESASEEVTDIKIDYEKNDVKRDAYPEINQLVEKYLDALINCDVDALGGLVNNIDNIDVDKLQKESEYIEDHKNLECYTKKGFEDGEYIVFVYEEIKIVNIDTLAPGMRRLYISTDDEGKLYIYNGRIDSKTEKYIQEIMNNEDIKDLIKNVDKKYEEAVSSDSDLKAFIDKIKIQTDDVKKDE